MADNFLLAFGGTGARCAEAAAYLCAARALRDPLHVLVIDPDQNNGNRRVAVDQLQRYYRIHETLRPGAVPFFSTPVNPERGEQSFIWGHPSAQTPFEQLIGAADLDPAARDLVELLYDERDLEMTFEQGYVGRAHVGSLDTYRILRRAVAEAARPEDGSVRAPTASDDPVRVFFRDLRAATDGDGGANLVVVGSIFGGTGASGIPVIPALVRDALGVLGEKVRIGSVQMAPYFVFGPPRLDDDPDSSLHPLATRTALHYYARSGGGYDRIYLLGAPSRETTNRENHRGGRAQRNDSHYAELAAALAFADFFLAPPAADAAPEVYACGATDVRWTSLPAAERLRLRHNMAAFATFCALHDRYVHPDMVGGRHGAAKWMVDLRRQVGHDLAVTDAAVDALRGFCSRFLEWAEQLQHTGAEHLFAVPQAEDHAGLATLVPGGQAGDPYDALYRELDRGGRFAQSKPVGWYLEAGTWAAERFCARNYNWWEGR